MVNSLKLGLPAISDNMMNLVDDSTNDGYKLDDVIQADGRVEEKKEKYPSSGARHLAHLTPEEIIDRRRLQNRKSKQKRRSEFHALYIAKKDASIMGSKAIKPKRSPSGYQLFTMENAAIIKAANPGLPFNEVLAIIGKQWKSAPDEVKDPYLDKASKLYNVYVKELEEYHIAVAKAGLNNKGNANHMGDSRKDGNLSDTPNNQDSSDNDYRHHSLNPCETSNLLDTRVLVESDYIEALKAENLRLLEENNEIKRLLELHQGSSAGHYGMQVRRDSGESEESLEDASSMDIKESMAMIDVQMHDNGNHHHHHLHSIMKVQQSQLVRGGGSGTGMMANKRHKTEIQE